MTVNYIFIVLLISTFKFKIILNSLFMIVKYAHAQCNVSIKGQSRLYNNIKIHISECHYVNMIVLTALSCTEIIPWLAST